MEFAHETRKQVTHSNKLVDFPLCINDLHAPMPSVKRTQHELKRRRFLKITFCAFFSLLMMQL
jgi:hypothetical protein